MVPFYAAQVSHDHNAEQAITSCNAPPHDYPSAQQWPLYHSYDHAEYISQGADIDYYEQSPWAALGHNIPVPLSTYTALLPPIPVNAPESALTYPDSLGVAVYPGDYRPAEQQIVPDVPIQMQQSDLLSDNTQMCSCSSSRQSAEKTFSKKDAGSAAGKRKRAVTKSDGHLIQRKSYFRDVSARVGFTITDPDTITSHDKRRKYLECLEEHVQWLYDQIHILGQKPLPFERISSYRGLKSRSIRIILVHKQYTLRMLNLQRIRAEDKFMELQRAVLMRQAQKGQI